MNCHLPKDGKDTQQNTDNPRYETCRNERLLKKEGRGTEHQPTDQGNFQCLIVGNTASFIFCGESVGFPAEGTGKFRALLHGKVLELVHCHHRLIPCGSQLCQLHDRGYAKECQQQEDAAED